jgi:hypothetical protein
LSFPDRQCLRIVPLQSDRFNHLAWLELCGQRPSEFILVGPKCQPLAGAHPTLLGPDSDLAYSSFFAGLGKLMDGLPADDGDLIEFLVESLGLYYRGQRLILLRIHTNKENKKEMFAQIGVKGGWTESRFSKIIRDPSVDESWGFRRVEFQVWTDVQGVVRNHRFLISDSGSIGASVTVVESGIGVFRFAIPSL